MAPQVRPGGKGIEMKDRQMEGERKKRMESIKNLRDRRRNERSALQKKLEAKQNATTWFETVLTPSTFLRPPPPSTTETAGNGLCTGHARGGKPTCPAEFHHAARHQQPITAQSHARFPAQHPSRVKGGCRTAIRTVRRRSLTSGHLTHVWNVPRSSLDTENRTIPLECC
ncbi:hypothetical protein CKAH01_01401 [Colletotrichum kahawae]|uniref:Uncharacterized protein n=1 Tax=Colletotrichum kahawae TaxID=34407 RepID=A0AAD9Y7L0_COLKA|nr:hypothetical protein CKAH01_01401 [Colletotrichum kahawae]